jgi:serine/threonine-protein kinase RsbW/sigma-B regulation protein RsbU (phosphoserine phosphatase)
MRRAVKRSFESLDEIFDCIDEVFRSAAIDRSIQNPVGLAVEELFTNMVKYNPDGPATIELSIEPVPRGVTVTLLDFDSEPFDVTRVRTPDVNAPLAERTVGGLGLYLIRKMVDSLR